jgi:hypothetical protein
MEMGQTPKGSLVLLCCTPLTRISSWTSNCIRLDTPRHLATMSDVNTLVFQPLQQFFKNSVHLVKKCNKPDRKGALL